MNDEDQTTGWRDMISDTLDIVIAHAESARELCEVGKEDKPQLIKMHLLQSLTAITTALEMLPRSS